MIYDVGNRQRRSLGKSYQCCSSRTSFLGADTKGLNKIFYCFSDGLYQPQSRDLRFCKTHALSWTSISFSSFIGPRGQGEQKQMAWGVGPLYSVCLQSHNKFKSFSFFFSFFLSFLSCSLAFGINPDVKWPLIEFDIATFLFFFFFLNLVY